MRLAYGNQKAGCLVAGNEFGAFPIAVCAILAPLPLMAQLTHTLAGNIEKQRVQSMHGDLGEHGSLWR